MPSFANIPIAVPACEIASNAYSTWYKRPSGEKMVVHRTVSYVVRSKMGFRELTRESYLLDMVAASYILLLLFQSMQYQERSFNFLKS